MLNELKKRMKVIKTCNLYLSLFTLGLSVSLTGPCLLDLQHMVNTDTRHIATIYTARSTGYLVGAIIGGILLDLVKSNQAVMMFCNCIVSATMFGVPWSRSVETLLGFMCVNGLVLGALETGGNVICIQLWGKDSGPFFQGLIFAFGLGGLLSSLIAAPFLEYFNELSSTSENVTNLEEMIVGSSANFSNNITHALDGPPKILYPYTIIGAFALVVTVLHLIVCIISPTHQEGPQEGKVDNSDRSFLFMFFVVIFTFLGVFVVAGTEIGYGQTLTTYAVKGRLHVTSTIGSYMTSAYWAASTLSRLASVYLAMKFSNLTLIIGDICVIAIAAFILLFLMPSEWALWLASVVYGIGMASVYGALVGWLSSHINISNKFSATFTVGSAAGEMVMPFLVAYFIETIPEMLAFVTASSCILTTIIVVIFYCMFKKRRKTNEPTSVECYVIDTNGKN